MRSQPLVDHLSAHAARLIHTPIRELVARDPDRAQAFSVRVGPLYANFARQKYDRAACDALFELARKADFAAAMRHLVDGAMVNPSEQRPALHTALRSDLGQTPIARAARAEALAALTQMAGLVAELEASAVTDVVNVGIGGSDLGPRLVVDALRHAHSGRFRVHFLANVDGHALAQLLPQLDPARTAVLLVSKSFRTQETLLNGALLRDWLGEGGLSRLYAVSSRPQAAEAFGVPARQVLAMAETVGGRYSLWSTVGFAIALALGMQGFAELLAGAAAMDAHALDEPAPRNVAAWHALTSIWNRNALGLDTQAVLPYDERLTLLPDYLQQLLMESLGKSVRVDGAAVGCATVPVWWGGVGSSSQHSFFQALHQGTDTVPADFIGAIQPAHAYPENHRALLANLLAQSQALANGEDNADAQRRYPGDRPSTLLLLDALTPYALGMLLALYEHSTYLQSVLWGINAFDQWGVELGKRLADGLLPMLRGGDASALDDAVTRELLAHIARGR
jgi:glucose-6-phosphate isomerase